MFRQRAGSKAQVDGSKKLRIRECVVKAMPAPEANAELQSNIDVCSNKLLILLITHIRVMLWFIQLLND
jgi:hypothetical protein